MTRVFVARLAGLSVFDPLGDQVGRVRDVVVTFSATRRAPRVIGLVVEVPGRRRVFVPMTRVTSIDAGQVITTGLVNMRRFDVADVTRLRLSGSAQSAAKLLETYDDLKAADLAEVIHDLTPKRRAEVAAALDDEKLADVMEELPEDDQVEILATLESERAADVLEAMQPDDAADLLSELPPEQAEQLLQMMEPDDAAPLRRLLAYDENTAGGLMTTEPVILGPEATIAEALAVVRRVELSPALAATVFVCRAPLETPTGKYLGVVHIQRLLREPPHAAIGSILDKDLEPLTPNAPLGQVTRMLATYNLVGVPVVDKDGRLLGAVTVDDVLDHILPDDWREDRHEVTHAP